MYIFIYYHIYQKYIYIDHIYVFVIIFQSWHQQSLNLSGEEVISETIVWPIFNTPHHMQYVPVSLSETVAATGLNWKKSNFVQIQMWYKSNCDIFNAPCHQPALRAFLAIYWQNGCLSMLTLHPWKHIVNALLASVVPCAPCYNALLASAYIQPAMSLNSMQRTQLSAQGERFQ